MTDRRSIEMAQKQLFKKLPVNARREALRKISDGYLCDLFEEDPSRCKEAPSKKVVYARDGYDVIVYLCAHCVTTYDVGDGDVIDYDLVDLLSRRKKATVKKAA